MFAIEPTADVVLEQSFKSVRAHRCRPPDEFVEAALTCRPLAQRISPIRTTAIRLDHGLIPILDRQSQYRNFACRWPQDDGRAAECRHH